MAGADEFVPGEHHIPNCQAGFDAFPILQTMPCGGGVIDSAVMAHYRAGMNRRLLLLSLAVLSLMVLPYRAPAPLIYRPGEGWTYEPVGGEGKWQMTRAKDQLDVAQAAFDKQAYSLALKAARRVVRVWPLSDYTPQAQYLVGRCYEAEGEDEKAFIEYQKLIEKHPKIPNYDEIVQRQYVICGRYLAGKWFKLWGYIPFFPSMDKTAEMYEKIVKNGAYSDVAAQAQLKVGEAREKQSSFSLAVKAYEVAADRYYDRIPVASEALFRAGLAYNKQAQTAEYDQTTAAQAISTFQDFMTLYPGDARVDKAKKLIGSLKSEQARGAFQTALFYEKRKRWRGALVYYNEVLVQDPTSALAVTARERIDSIKNRIVGSSK
jgi:outer membrane protein assembly factor BamD